MTPENTFIAWVNRHLSKQIYAEKTHNQYRRGMPDVYYEAPGHILWAEYKWYPKETVRAVDICSKLSPNQLHWLTRAYNNDIPVAVIVGSPKTAAILPKIALSQPHIIPWQPRLEVVRQLETLLGVTQ